MTGWNSTGWSGSANAGNSRVRREAPASVPRVSGRWTPSDVAITVAAFFIHWEVGLAFLALKLWQQASGYPGSAFSFAREKWEGLVGAARGVLGGSQLPFSLHVGPRSSGNTAFDLWRETELARIEAERTRLQTAERDFASYREELLHATDRQDFERFMQTRTSNAPIA